MSIIKKIGYALLIVFIVLQFIRPTKNLSQNISANDIRNHYTIAADVENILKNSCFDCHSNNTIYPWYTNIQPIGLWMESHVKDAKEEINFSEFGSYAPKRMNRKYKEIIDVVKEEEMPLFSYTLIHGYAKLSKQQKGILVAWAEKQKSDLNYIEEKPKQ